MTQDNEAAFTLAERVAAAASILALVAAVVWVWAAVVLR